jgi:nucleotide-binding universal stress UspA family protein
MVQQAFEHNKKKQPSERSIRKVLVALDETALSNQVIAFITKHNWDPECEFKLLSVVEKPAAFLLSESAAKQLSDRLADETEKRLQEFSSTLIAEMKNSRIETTVTKGQAKKVILSTAKDWNADLLIVGCHFQNSISRFLLGSVSLPTLCEAPCSVLLIKESQLAKPAIDEKELIVHRSESVVPVTK